VNQEQRANCKVLIDGLRNPLGADTEGSFVITRHEVNMIIDMLQCMLEEIDSKPETITLRDQFAIAIAGGFAANTERSALSMASAYEWADLALKGRGQ
jgi:hypothetical protein